MTELEVARGLEQMAMEQRNQLFDRLAPLLLAAENAAYKLRSLGNTFSGPRFTDRYGDGPHCLALAENLLKAIEAVRPNAASLHTQEKP